MPKPIYLMRGRANIQIWAVLKLTSEKRRSETEKSVVESIDNWQNR